MKRRNLSWLLKSGIVRRDQTRDGWLIIINPLTQRIIAKVNEDDIFDEDGNYFNTDI